MNRSVLVALALSASVGGMLSGKAFATVDTESLLASGTHTYSNNTTNTVFSLNALQPVGSGVFDPFVRIQGNKTSFEQGYNTPNDAATLDNHPIGPGDYLMPMSGGILSDDHKVHLLLDANEPGGAKSPITLTDLMLVISTNPSKSGTGAAGLQFPVPFDAGDEIVYHMNLTTDLSTGNPFQILINSNDRLGTGNGGSGQADLEVVVDLSGLDLSGLVDANHFLYVYSEFSNFQSGYEEWRASNFGEGSGTGTGIPEPASLGLLGIGAAGLMLRRRQR